MALRLGRALRFSSGPQQFLESLRRRPAFNNAVSAVLNARFARQRMVMRYYDSLGLLSRIMGHSGYIVGLLEYAVTDIVWLRRFAIGGCGMVVGYQLLQPRVQWVTAAWCFIYVVVNIVQLIVLAGDRPPPLTWEESRLHAHFSEEISVRDFHSLLSIGEWLWLVEGATLTQEDGSNADRSFLFITQGVCDVLVGGRRVAQLLPGSTVGEVGVATEAKRSSATVVAAGNVRCCSIPLAKVQGLLEEIPALRLPLERLVIRSMAKKVAQSNDFARERCYRAVLEVACSLSEDEAILKEAAAFRERQGISVEKHRSIMAEVPQCWRQSLREPLQAPEDYRGGLGKSEGELAWASVSESAYVEAAVRKQPTAMELVSYNLRKFSAMALGRW